MLLTSTFSFLHKQPAVSGAHAAGVRVHRSAGTGLLRGLIVLGLLLLGWFGWWFIDARHIGYAPLFWLLCISLGFKLLRMLHEWYHYASISYAQAPLPPCPAPATSVDILTTACPGEPHDMIIRTLEAMQRIRYPHTSYLCDEGDDPLLRAECQRLGVVHVTRQQKINAKAGNINNALRQATGEFCVILDPDHVPAPEFLDEVLPYFADPTVGFVQVVQAYGNQQASLVARGAAEQTYHFYGPMMMGMNAYGTVQAIGANCTFRRSALDSIGGHAAGLTEDMHTAMRLHAAGWRSVYAPVVVSRGLVPVSLAAFYAQQLKWSRGCFDLLVHVYPRLFGQFTWRQRIHYFLLPLYFLSGLITLLDVSVPLLGLGLHRFPWHVPLGGFLLHMGPVVVTALLIRLQAQRWLREPHETGLHLVGGLLRVGTWWIYLLGLMYTILNVRVPYIPTPKEDTLQNDWRLSLPNITLLLLSVGVGSYGLLMHHDTYGWLLTLLAAFNVLSLLLVILMGQQLLLQRLAHQLRAISLANHLLVLLPRLRATLHTRLLPALRHYALPGALAVGVASIGGSIWQQHHTQLQQAELAQQWLWQGDSVLHFGQTHSLPLGQLVRAGAYVSAPAPHTTLVHWTLTAGQLRQLTPDALRELSAAGYIPLLSWPIRARTDTSWAPTLRRLARNGSPVLLRPVLPPALTASQHRQQWQRLARIAQPSPQSSIILVWTLPAQRPVVDYFPGRATVNWLAAECPNGEAGYAAQRAVLAHYPELHQLPVALLTDTAVLRSRLPQLASHYPELKALINRQPTPTTWFARR
ncbi:cellulose synthase catalytic subunit [Hymenobacter sp. UYP22]|uniref:glycosyltransferase family 2 protein n=1 Tax=Hymenobacter sp. UYP22 TaxID=3156348 RepID=UPI003393ABE5